MWHGPAPDRASKALADRVVSLAGTNEQRIDLLYRLLFTRPARPMEQEQILNFLDADRIEKLGDKANPADAELAAASLAAWKDLALVLLNSNEFVFVH